MGTPTNRTPVRVARGSTTALNTGLSDIQEGEIVWDTTLNRLQVKEGSALENHTVDTSTLAPLASPTFTGTVAIPNIANLETAVAANTAKVTNVATNLSAAADGTSLTVSSSDGTDASIPAVTTSAWGAMTDEDKTKLDGITAGANAVLATDQSWTGAQRGALTTVTAATTTAFDFDLGNNFYIDMATAAITTINASNATAGQSGSIIIKGHGSNTMAGWNAVYKFSGGTAPTITADAAKYDRIDYIIYDASNIHMVWSGNY